MASESLYNQLLSHLTEVSSQTVSGTNSDGYAALGSVSKLSAEPVINPAADTESKSAGLGAKVTAAGIKFGSPSQKTQSVTDNSTNWGQLVSSVASGGLTSLLGGAGSLGLGTLVSGLISLFGGGKSTTPPPLTLFQLPASQDVTAYIRSGGSSVYQGSMDQTVVSKTQGSSASAQGSVSSSLKNTADSANAPASKGASAHPPNNSTTISTQANIATTDVNSQWFMERSNDIAAAVRNAMLNSSSLNDVVAEI